jgi:hypothetical protein
MAAGPLTRDRRWFVAIFFVLVAFPFFGVFPYINVVMNPNENTRTYMTIAAVENKTFQLDQVVARFGWVNDMASVKDKQGVPHYYSVKGPLNSLIGVPVYWLQVKWAIWRKHPPPPITETAEKRNEWFEKTTWVLRFVTVQLPCFLFLLWFERYLRGFSKDTSLRLMAVAAAGLGTNYLGYSHMFASHSLVAVAAFLGFGMAERELREQPDAKKRSLWAAFVSGMGIAAATGFEYHAFFMSAVLAVFAFFVFWRPTRLLAYGLGAAVPMAMVAFYQWKAFGSPLTPGHKFVENPQWAAEHARGLYGVSMPTLKAFGALSFDPGYGFFGMSPFMLLGLLGAFVFVLSPQGRGRAQRVQHTGAIVWFFAMFALWFAMCGAAEWRAGWTLGARRAGAAPPFFALGALMLLERIATKWPNTRNAMRGVALGTTLVGVASLGFVGLMYNTLPRRDSAPRDAVGAAARAHRRGPLTTTVSSSASKERASGTSPSSRCFSRPSWPRLQAASASRAKRSPRAEQAGGSCSRSPSRSPRDTPRFHVPQDRPRPTRSTTGRPTGSRRDETGSPSWSRAAPTTPCAWHWIADAQEILHMDALAAQNRPVCPGSRVSSAGDGSFGVGFPERSAVATSPLGLPRPVLSG